MTEGKSKLLVSEEVDIVKDQGVDVGLVDWHEHNPCLPILLIHLFEHLNTLSVYIQGVNQATKSLG